MLDIFGDYKPLRNQLRQAQLAESLGVMRAYLQHLQFRQSFPNDIEVVPQFLNAKTKPEKMVFEWELEVLVREIIINAVPSDMLALPVDLRRWNHFSGAVNRLKNLENEIAKAYYGKENVLLEFYRLAHREFPWQTLPSAIWINRYYKIFSHPQLDAIIQRVTGLTAKELYTFGLGLTGFYLQTFALDYPTRIEIADIAPEKFDLFLKRFATDIGTMKKMMEGSEQLNENYVYTLNPLRQYPMIKMKVRGVERFVAPVPTFLFWRFTSGIYYEICKESDFALPFGESFQNYVGEVAKRATKDHHAFSVLPEAEYHVGRDKKNTTDWIISGKTAALFVEVKTKRLRIDAKVELFSQEVLIEELGKMAEFIGQLYATIRDYRDNRYPKFPYDSRRRIFPLVVTLENWYLFSPPIEQELARQVAAEFDRRGLDKNVLNEMPYGICCIEEFERMMQIMAPRNILDFMDAKLSDPAKRQWPFASFMANHYWEDFQKPTDFFAEVIDEINPEIRNRPKS